MDLPIDHLMRVVSAQMTAHSASPLFITISGAHLYGFSSPDSDFDVRGAHLIPLAQVVSLGGGRETIEFSGVEDGREMDLVTHDAAKFFGLMLKKNGYVLEQVFSPLVVVGGPALDELREIARGCITRHLHHHYRGFSENQIERMSREPIKKAKTLLYVYRVLLTGIHVLRTGEIESHLPTLLEHHPQDGVTDLIRAKVREAAPLPEALVAAHEGALNRLREELGQAFESSSLPETPCRTRELDEFLVRLRLGGSR